MSFSQTFELTSYFQHCSQSFFSSFSLKSLCVFRIEKIGHDEEISKVKVKELTLERDIEKEIITRLQRRIKQQVLKY